MKKATLIRMLATQFATQIDNGEIVLGDPIHQPDIKDINIKPHRSNEWRGGSAGKGGKTKWPRR